MADTLVSVAREPLFKMVTFCEEAPDPDETLNVSGFGLAVKPTPPLAVPPTFRVTVKVC